MSRIQLCPGCLWYGGVVQVINNNSPSYSITGCMPVPPLSGTLSLTLVHGLIVVFFMLIWSECCFFSFSGGANLILNGAPVLT